MLRLWRPEWVPARPEWAEGGRAQNAWPRFGELASVLKTDDNFPELSTVDYSVLRLPSKAHFEFGDLLPEPEAEMNELLIEAHSTFGLGLHVAFGFATVLSISRGILALRRTTIRDFLVSRLGGAPEPTTIEITKLFKTNFNTTAYFAKEVGKHGHSHPKSATARASANDFIRSFASSCGREVYHYQTSQKENDLGLKGARDLHWAKDMTQDARVDDIQAADIISLVDVDYYLDMPSFLAANAKPMILYTIQPECAGEDLGETSFSLSGDTVNWSVKGGAQYSHKLWNYSTDWFTATEWKLGVPYRTTVYDVQTRQVERHRQIVLLTPLRVCHGISAIVAWSLGRELTRCNFRVAGGFSKLTVWDNENRRIVSFARSGMNTSATILESTYNSLVSTQRIAPKGSLSLYQAKALLKAELGDKCDAEAPIVVDFFNNSEHTDTTVVNVVERPNMVTFAFSNPDPTDKPALVAFGKPYVPPAFVPLNSIENVQASIVGRVIKTKEAVTKMDLKLTPFKREVMLAFVGKLIPKNHVGQPYDFNEIAARQSKPGQKKDLVDAGFGSRTNASKVVTSFMKPEAYGKPTDPRNITTFKATPKIDYAGFIYALMDLLKDLPCYAFGKSPKIVAERVAEIATAALRDIACGDIHRMDGHVNFLCRMLEREIGLAFFAPEYHADFIAAHEAHIGNRGVTSFGNWYNQGDTRGSGEMGTSLWNTIITLFIFFLYFCMENKKDYDAAWDRLLRTVLAGGDDSAAADIEPTLFTKAAYNMGFIMKVPVFAKGAPGVNFLARTYGPYVWHGDPNSMCSIKRQMEKIHLTPRCDIPDTQKLFEKCTSFALTDLNTPVIGDLCKSVLRLSVGMEDTGTIFRFGDEWDPADQYPNKYEDWMDEIVEDELFLVDTKALVEFFDSASSLPALLDPPPFYDAGREYTFDNWEPDVGMLIDRTFRAIEGKELEPLSTAIARKRNVERVVKKTKFGSLD